MAFHVAKPYLEFLIALPPPPKFLDVPIALTAQLHKHLKHSCLILSVSVKQRMYGWLPETEG